MEFKDYFSVARGYARYRPTYPHELFDYLVSSAPGRCRAWDAGTGSGQAAVSLASRFDGVVATDSSPSQLARAQAAGVLFVAAGAESPPLADATIDLVTVAQAMHWFDLDRFYRAVRRVARPGGILAAWSYPLASLGDDVDPLLERFAKRKVGAYWPEERRHVDREYRDIPFPFERLEAPGFEMTVRWSLAELLGYVGTWSSVHRYRQATGEDPMRELAEMLKARWGTARRRLVTWPLACLIGRVPSSTSGSVPR